MMVRAVVVLPRAGLADQPDGLAFAQPEGDIVDRVHRLEIGDVLDGQVLDFQ
jgi:hypothetical protein